jgi:hypothetical protein
VSGGLCSIPNFCERKLKACDIPEVLCAEQLQHSVSKIYYYVCVICMARDCSR